MATGTKKAVKVTVTLDPSKLQPGDAVNIYMGTAPSATANIDYGNRVNAEPIPVYPDSVQRPSAYADEPYAVSPYAGGDRDALTTVDIFLSRELANGTWWFAAVPVDHCGNESAGTHQEVSIQVDSRPEPPTNLAKGGYVEATDQLTLTWGASPTF